MANTRGDHYYGGAVRSYEAARSSSPIWKREQQAIADLVETGPLIDIPFGTGRFTPIYREKGIDFIGVDISSDMLAHAVAKYPNLTVMVGDIFDLRFPDKSFATAVCCRMFHWFHPRDVRKAIAELSRVAHTIIVSNILGDSAAQRSSGTWTHDRDHFYESITGLYIDERRLLSQEKTRKSEMFRLRPPTWDDVLRQFADRENPPALIDRLCGVWTRRFGLKSVDLTPGMITVEYWKHDELGGMLDEMAAAANRDSRARGSIITNNKPRRTDCPLVAFRTQGKTLLIDGRCRVNQWRKIPGRYPMLVVEVDPK